MTEPFDVISQVAHTVLFVAIIFVIAVSFDFAWHARRLSRDTVFARLSVLRFGSRPYWAYIMLALCFIITAEVVRLSAHLFGQIEWNEAYMEMAQDLLGAIGFVLFGMALVQMDLSVRARASPLAAG